MTYEETCAALLEALEIQTRLGDELRAAPVDAAWRAALLMQADKERLAAFDSWRVHLVQPIELSVQRVGEHATLRYGSILRVLPIAPLKTGRGAHFVAETLWDAAHPRPDIEQCVQAWNEARPVAVVDLVKDIAERVADLA
jgi:hypothetical protein